MSEQDEIMTIEEVAKYLKQSRGWVRDHASGRRRPFLPSVKFGRSRRFYRAAVRKFVEDCIAETLAAQQKGAA